MHILLTGATGLIGKEVGKKLVAQGHRVTVVSRSPIRARMELPFPCSIHEWQGESDVFPDKALTDIDAVIHLAGEPVADGRWTEERKKKIHDSRVLGTRKVIEAIARNANAAKQIQTFVCGSAVGFYGSRGDEVLNEQSAPGDDFLAQVVIDWENEADAFTAINQGRVAHIRTGVVLARHGGAMEKFLPLFQKGLGGRLADGKQWMSWIHFDDICNLFVFAVENEKAKGAINGTAPEPTRNDRFTVALARAIQRPVFLPVPESALKLALGEMSMAIIGSARVVPAKAQELGFEFQFPELVKALDEICLPLRGGQHEMFAEQWVGKTPDEIFPYFCSETNLEELTPKYMGFKVIGKSTKEIQEGTLIDYRLSLHGVPMKWRTRIEEWAPDSKFVDTQLSGPYKRWHHTHEFIPFAGGTLMRDRVQYKLPLGWLGDIAASWKVTDQVNDIFEFRRKKIAQLFGDAPSSSTTKSESATNSKGDSK